MANNGDDDDADGPVPAPKSSRPRDPIIRNVIGHVALDLATTPEGRAAGLSVEVWPDQGVWLRVRSGHELRLTVDAPGTAALVRWERIDPKQGGAHTTRGDLGSSAQMTEDDLRQFVSRWLGWRAGG